MPIYHTRDCKHELEIHSIFPLFLIVSEPRTKSGNKDAEGELFETWLRVDSCVQSSMLN